MLTLNIAFGVCQYIVVFERVICRAPVRVVHSAFDFLEDVIDLFEVFGEGFVTFRTMISILISKVNNATGWLGVGSSCARLLTS